MRTGWRTELPMLALIGAMFLASLASWPFAPERIAVHWNLAGEADRYGGKFEGLFFLPLITAGIYALMRFLPRIDPGRANYEQFRKAYYVIRIGLVAVMAIVHAVVLLWARGVELNISLGIPVLVGAMFIVFGNFLSKLRPNWFIGIRTPWTLSSKRSWNKTHRFGRWVFMLAGAGLMLCGLLTSSTYTGAVIGVVVGGVALLFVYSYLVWRNDPDRVPPGNTEPGRE